MTEKKHKILDEIKNGDTAITKKRDLCHELLDLTLDDVLQDDKQLSGFFLIVEGEETISSNGYLTYVARLISTERILEYALPPKIMEKIASIVNGADIEEIMEDGTKH